MLLCSRHLPGQTLRVPTDSQVETVLPSVISGTLRMRTFFFKITPVEQLVKHEESVSLGYKNNDKPVETTYGRTVFNTGILAIILLRITTRILGRILARFTTGILARILVRFTTGILARILVRFTTGRFLPRSW